MNELEYHTPEVKETEKFYKRSVWWVGHKNLLKKIGLGFWIAVDVLLVLFAIWVMVDTFLINYEKERGILRELLVENQTSLYESTQTQVADGLKIEGPPTVLASGEGEYDLVGFVTNSNEDWWAEFMYQMETGGEAQTEPFVSFVYPGETRAVMTLSQEVTRVSSAKLAIPTTSWHRIDTHAIPDFEAWFNERVDFEITDAEFTSVIGASGESIGRTSFNVKNNTPFSYWSVPFNIILKRGSAVIGVNTTELEQLESGETREAEMSWFQPMPTVTDLEIIPTLNIFDSTVYMPPPGGSSLDTRVRFGQ